MAVTGRLADGWLTVPYSGPEMVIIEIGFGGQWFPAYLDWEHGQRVARVRRDEPVGEVRLRTRPVE